MVCPKCGSNSFKIYYDNYMVRAIIDGDEMEILLKEATCIDHVICNVCGWVVL